jgi:hypothetical protein
MGETKTAKNEVKMISVEQANAQMQNVLQQANSKMQQLAAHSQQLEAMLRDRTVEFLFKVVEHDTQFTSEFVVKCVEAIESYLTQVALTEPSTEDEVKDEVPAATKED